MDDDVKIRILVLDRSWVIVCRCPDPERFTFWLPVTHVRVIRTWGTTGHGLGQLVHGPTPQTVLEDVMPSAKIPVRAIILPFDVEQEPWEPHLTGGRRASTGRARRRSSPTSSATADTTN